MLHIINLWWLLYFTTDTARQFFQPKGGHINIAFDTMGEQIHERDDDISSDEESSQSISHSNRYVHFHPYNIMNSWKII